MMKMKGANNMRTNKRIAKTVRRMTRCAEHEQYNAEKAAKYAMSKKARKIAKDTITFERGYACALEVLLMHLNINKQEC